MSQESELQQLQGDINAAIEGFFDAYQMPHQLAGSQAAIEAYDRLKEFCVRPGKRVRGAMAAVAYEALSVSSNHGTAVDLAVAVELCHTYLLIIDDVMDRSDTRRGGKTIHVRYKDDGESQHTSNMLAVSVGLLVQHMAAEAMTDLDVDSTNIVNATRVLNKALLLTGYGQLEDLFNTPQMLLSEDDILRIYELKTSHYTFINPLVVGATLAGRNTPEITSMIEGFGLPAGIAFQLQDDIIGLFGDEKTTGKSHVDDLKEGKMTAMMRKTLECASTEQVQQVNSILGNNAISDQDHQDVMQIVEDTGAKEYIEQKISESTVQARSALEQGQWPFELKAFLEALLDYSVGRKQ